MLALVPVCPTEAQPNPKPSPLHRPAQTHAMAAQPGTQEAPGLPFLRRRLERATAVPPAERSPEVAAFVESAQLLREACELLPLRANGRPALSAGEATQCRVLLAVAKVTRAELVCPAPMLPISGCNLRQHFEAYAEPVRNLVEGGTLSDMAWALMRYRALHEQFIGGSLYGVVSAGRQLVESLQQAAFQRTFNRQMQQLAGDSQRPLLSAHQLLYGCCCLVAQSAVSLFSKPASCQVAAAQAQASGLPPPAEQHAAAQEALRWSSEAMLRLEPQQPQSWGLGWMQKLASSQASSQEAMEMILRAFQLAQQQRSDWWVIQAGSTAMMLAATEAAFTNPNPATLEAALAVVPHLEPALQRCRRLLPEHWVRHVELQVQATQKHAAMVQGGVQSLQQTRGSTAGGRAAGGGAAESSAGAQVLQSYEAILEQRSCRCHGCGMPALGLRKCSRCKQAQYCRYTWQCPLVSRAVVPPVSILAVFRALRVLCSDCPGHQWCCIVWPALPLACSPECQRAHWPAHKRECKPA